MKYFSCVFLTVSIRAVFTKPVTNMQICYKPTVDAEFWMCFV